MTANEGHITSKINRFVQRWTGRHAVHVSDIAPTNYECVCLSHDTVPPIRQQLSSRFNKEGKCEVGSEQGHAVCGWCSNFAE